MCERGETVEIPELMIEYMHEYLDDEISPEHEQN